MFSITLANSTSPGVLGGAVLGVTSFHPTSCTNEDNRVRCPAPTGTTKSTKGWGNISENTCVDGLWKWYHHFIKHYALLLINLPNNIASRFCNLQVRSIFFYFISWPSKSIAADCHVRHDCFFYMKDFELNALTVAFPRLFVRKLILSVPNCKLKLIKNIRFSVPYVVSCRSWVESQNKLSVDVNHHLLNMEYMPLC